MISASEIDQSTDAFSNQILSDDSGVNEVLTDDPEGCSTETNPEDTEVQGETTDPTPNPNDSTDPNVDEHQEEVLEKTTLSSVDYVIKNKYLNCKSESNSYNKRQDPFCNNQQQWNS